MPEYKQYIRCHIVKATPMTRGNYNKYRGWEIPDNENPADEGYHVVYPDGYESWCQKAQFEAAGRPIDGMTFGMAIEAMKQDKKVARRGWNGKGMYLWLLPAASVKAEWCKEPASQDSCQTEWRRGRVPWLGAHEDRRQQSPDRLARLADRHALRGLADCGLAPHSPQTPNAPRKPLGAFLSSTPLPAHPARSPRS